MRSFPLALLTLLTLPTGCSRGTGVELAILDCEGPCPRFVYACNSVSNSITGYSVDPRTGALTPVPGQQLFYGLGWPIALAVHPSRRLLYVANQNGYVLALAIDAATGALSPASHVVDAYGIRDLVIDPAGRWLRAIGREALGYSITEPTGVLTPVGGSPFDTGDALSAAVQPGGRFLFVAHSTYRYLGGPIHEVRTYSVDPATGAVALAQSWTPSAAPNLVALDRTGDHLYLLTSTDEIITFDIAEMTGELSMRGQPLAAAHPVWDLAVAGGFLFVGTGSGPSEIAIHAIDATTGEPAAQASTTIAAGLHGLRMAIDASEQLLYVTSYESNDVRAYRIDAPTGRLVAVPGSPFAAGAGPGVIAIVQGQQ
ncbi:MAG: beta-propeller fold lactonase family protein [Planctomycetes bacterium]|nr:beta-propeller fold lactonase family protein [Planctomycetota bacterium]